MLQPFDAERLCTCIRLVENDILPHAGKWIPRVSLNSRKAKCCMIVYHNTLLCIHFVWQCFRFVCNLFHMRFPGDPGSERRGPAAASCALASIKA